MNQDAIVTEPRTEAGKRLVGLIEGMLSVPYRSIDDPTFVRVPEVRTAIAAIEAEAAQRALDDVRAKVEALDTHEAHAFEPGIEWLCVPDPDRDNASKDCGNDEAHYRLVDRDAVLAALQDRGADREDVR